MGRAATHQTDRRRTARTRSVTKEEFDTFNPSRGQLTALIADEQEWYADERGNVIGVLILDKIDKDWAYVILGRDRRRAFRAIDTGVSIASRDDAREQLRARLREFARSGKTVFSQ